MQTDRKEMIARVEACIAQGANPSSADTLDIVAVNDPNWEHRDTLVSLYMFRVIGYQREGSFHQNFERFMLPKAQRTGEPFDQQKLTALAQGYLKTWDGETGDLDKLHEFIDAFTTKQLAYIGI